MKKLLRLCTVLVLVAGALAIGTLYVKPYVGILLHRVVRSAVFDEIKDIRFQMQNIASEQTAVFVMEHMSNVPIFTDRFALFDQSLKSIDPKLDGLYCEFGVYMGASINYIASKTDHTIHGFDSFEGLPEIWRTGYAKGKFKVSGLPETRENVQLHKGWFNESLPVWAKENSGPMTFIHFDADLYSSTKTVLDILGDRIVPGTIIQFDEYFNYPGWQNGEYKAFDEFVKLRHIKFEYLGYCNHGGQVAVRILSIGTTDNK